MSGAPKQHGGRRAGSGRPSTFGERKQTTSMRLTPTLLAFLASLDESTGDYVERKLRRSAEFKRWKANQ